MHDVESCLPECLDVDREPAGIAGKAQENAVETRSARSKNRRTSPAWRSRLADGVLDRFLLALTFLLGAFPLKDTDFYWHLRTGDWIRQTGRVPRT